MLRLLEAGLAAACFKIVAVALATLAVLLFAENKLIPEPLDLLRSGGGISSSSALSLLKWTYLLLAIGTASTSSRFVDVTAERIRNASRVMRPTEPFHATKSLLVQLCLAAIGFVVLVLQPPPETLVEVSRHFGWGWGVLIGWPALMSVGLAGFGASAQAALKAL